MAGKYHSYSMYRRSLYTLVLGVLLSGVLAVCVLGYAHSSVLMEETRTQAEGTAYILANNMDTLCDEILVAASYLGGNDASINAMMFQRKKDPMANFYGYLQMQRLQSTYSCISFISLYNQRLDSLISTVSFDNASKTAIKEHVVSGYPSYARSQCTPMSLINSAGKEMDRKTRNALTFTYYSDLSGPGNIGALVIGIDCSYMQDYLKTLSGDESATIMLVDRLGRVISHPDDGLILRNVSDKPFVAEALSSKKAIDSRMMPVDGENTLVTWRGSAYGWTYISLLPYSAINSRMLFWRNVTMLIVLGVALFSALYAFLGARHMFKPLKTLLGNSNYTPGADAMNEMDYLNAQLSDYRSKLENEKQVQEVALRHWAQGAPDGDARVFREQLQGYLGARQCRMALVAADRTDAYRALPDAKRREILQALGNFVRDALGGPAKRIVFGGNLVAVVFTGAADTNVADAVRAGLEAFYGQFLLPCCAALPPKERAMEELPALFAEADDLLKERYFQQGADTSVITEKQTRARSTQYDFKWEFDIWQAIRHSDTDEVERAVDRFMTVARQCDYEYARLFVHQLFYNVIAYFCAAMPGVDADGMYARIRLAAEMDTLDLVHEAMSGMFTDLAQNFTAPPDADAASRIAETAMRLTRENYTDPYFTLNNVAEAMELSPTYFNRMFKKSAGQSYSAYLNAFRLSMLCSLLRTTSEPLSRICAEVGIANESYCYTLFKKEYGVTPSQYRARYAEREETPE